MTSGMVENTLQLVGIAQPLLSAAISAQTSGQIQNFPVREGTYLKEGELICQLEKNRKIIDKDLALALLKQAQTELAKLKAGSREQEINAAQAEVELRRAAEEKAKLHKKRMKDLFAKGVVPLEQKQNSQLDYEQAKAANVRADADLRLAVEGSRTEDIMIAKAKVEQAEAELEKAEDELKKAGITAPFSGVITQKYKEVGEWTDEGGTLVELINIDRLLIHTYVAERDIGRIKHGQITEVVFDAYPGRTFSGAIRDIIPKADPKSHTFLVKIEVDNRRHKLYAGMLARLKLTIGVQREALLVPKDALVNQNGEQAVFLVKGGEVRQVKVVPGQNKGDLIVVDGELSAGDLVVVTNNEGLRDKMKVKISSSK